MVQPNTPGHLIGTDGPAAVEGAAATTTLAKGSTTLTLTQARSRDTDLAARLDETIDRALADRKIVGTSVKVVRSGEVIYQRAAGYADREAGRAMRVDALFRLASLSKTIVSAAALALVEQGIGNQLGRPQASKPLYSTVTLFARFRG